MRRTVPRLRRAIAWTSAALAIALVGCGDDPAAELGNCPDEERERTLPSGERERWCAVDGVADGAYARFEGTWLVREGRFSRGQPSGTWTDWYARAALPSDTPQKAVSYRFDDGLADGDFVAWRPDGTTLWERSWNAGEPCGTWIDHDETPARVTTYPLCEGGSQVEVDPDALGLVSPRVTDVGWDGKTCPSGTRLEEGTDPETGRVGEAAWCNRDGVADGPAWRRSGGTSAYPLEVGHFSASKRDGLWVRFHPPGDGEGQHIAEVGEYSAGVRTGAWKTYRADGTLEHRGTYRDGREDGTWEGYAPSLLRAWSGDYADGAKTGTWTTYHADLPIGVSFAAAGTIATAETWVDGVRSGPFTHWFRGGAKAREGTYVNGAWGGLVTTWWESGAKRFETTYVGGIATGAHTQWTEDGQLEARGDYRFGEPDGVWTTWQDPNPLILFFGGPARRTRASSTWVEGRLEGPHVGYYEVDGAGGARAWEGTYSGGVDDGPATFYWPSGVVLAEGVYEGGAAQGVWQTHFESGALRATLPYARDLLHGLYTERFESGPKRVEGRYQYDRRVGTWTTWDASGAVLTTEDCGVDGAACDCASTESCR